MNDEDYIEDDDERSLDDDFDSEDDNFEDSSMSNDVIINMDEDWNKDAIVDMSSMNKDENFDINIVVLDKFQTYCLL